MTVTLTPEESEQFFYIALCNGIPQLQAYGIDLSYNSDDYKKARVILEELNTQLPASERDMICREDVWLQILRQDDKLLFTDTEDGDQVEITLVDVHDKVVNTPLEHLVDMVREQDDATTADVILQTVLYGEILFS